MNDGQWHDVIVHRRGTEASLYIDDVLEDTGATSGVTNIDNTALMTAGRSACTGAADGTTWFTGRLDEIKIVKNN